MAETFYRVLIIIACFIVGYLCGSIPNGVIISKIFYKKDVRNYGSHNSGGTNTGRVFGKKAGLITILLDIIKVLIPFIVAIRLFEFNVTIKEFMNPTYNTLSVFGEGNTLNQLCYYIVPVGGMLGHAYSIFLKFKGGKIVSTFACYCLGTTFLSVPVVLPVFLITLKAKKYVSLGSIVASGFTVLLNLAIFLTYLFTFREHGFGIVDYLMWFGIGPRCSIYLPLITIFSWLLLVYKHKANIDRILDGTENKITWMK